jgi:hypothetical protein
MGKRTYTFEMDTGILGRAASFAGVLFFVMFLVLGPLFNIQPALSYVILSLIICLSFGIAIFFVFSKYTGD